jgi:ankyrin repeat protein
MLLLGASILLSCCQILGPSKPGAATDYTPVFAAASSGDVAAVRAAIEAQPRLVRQKEWRGNTLLHDAVEKGQGPVVRLLLEHKADVNARNSNGFTALHSAAQNGDLDMIKLLLSKGARRDAVDDRGRTPRDVATAWGHVDAAAIL